MSSRRKLGLCALTALGLYAKGFLGGDWVGRRAIQRRATLAELADTAETFRSRSWEATEGPLPWPAETAEVMIDGHSIIEWYWNETAKIEEDLYRFA